MSDDDVRFVNKCMLARETGWTFHYIEEQLDADEIWRVLEVFDAQDRGTAWVRKRAQERANAASSPRRR